MPVVFVGHGSPMNLAGENHWGNPVFLRSRSILFRVLSCCDKSCPRSFYDRPWSMHWVTQDMPMLRRNFFTRRAAQRGDFSR